MRGMRRIVGDPRFSTAVSYTDLQVREKLGVPSVDCVLMSARLRYLGRLVRHRPQTLISLLHSQRESSVLPWVSLVTRDCDDLAARGLVPFSPGSFSSSPEAWSTFIATDPGWGRALETLSFAASVLDRHLPSAPAEASRALAFSCGDCPGMFASARALASHRRSKHGARAEYRRYVPSAVCPACGTSFSSRVRCLVHIGDTRRPKCQEWLLEHGTLLLPATLSRLDEEDKKQRTEAQRRGLTGPVASTPARRADGRVY